jgi:Kelch motif
MRRIVLLAVFVILAQAGWSLAAEGGPDEFGYVWTDQAPYTWIDATGGEAVFFDSEDDLEGPYPIGFSFDFYGEKYESFYVSSNGRIVLRNQQETFKIPCIPSPAPYLSYIALYWDDFDPIAGGSAYIRRLGEEPARYLVVEFNDLLHWNSTDDGITAQVILAEETSDILLQYQDPSTEAGLRATVGLMSHIEDIGLPIICHSPVLLPESSYLIRHPAFIDVDVADAHVAAEPGGSSVFQVSTRNATDGPATIAFEWEGASWPISITPQSLELNPGESGLVTVQVDVPGVADLWETDTFTFTAVSEQDATAEGSVTLTASAGPDWQVLPEVLPTDFQNHAVVTDSEWIYVLSNYLAPGVSGDFVRFNLDGQIETLTPLDPPISVTDGVYLWNKLVFLGGIDEDGTVTDAMNVWDLKEEQWVDQYRLPAPTTWAATVVLDQKLYVIGGFDGQFSLDEVWVFDPAPATWQRAASLNYPRQRPLAGAIGGRIIVAGGTDIVSLVSAEIYDPFTDTWTEIAPPPRELTGAADCTCNDRFYAIGGRQGDRATSLVYEYDPALDNWTPVSRLQTGRSMMEADLLQGNIVVAGGMAGLFSPTDSAELLYLDCADEIVPDDREFGSDDDDDDTDDDHDVTDDDDDDDESCCGC